ncbi:MAG: diaminopimelate dehydrogenase [Porphyromonadaceae bacterium]|nr:diaminopimelate dehydrogenase [Porphyromonadaceae bacterium]
MNLKKIRAAVIGFGNIGSYAIDAINEAEDFELAGLVRRSIKPLPERYSHIKQVENIDELGKVDVAILAVPSRSVYEEAPKYLAKGINTIDSFDIHTEKAQLRKQLAEEDKKQQPVAVLSAGWDPGSDSIVRTMMQAIAPKGITYTNFGPGMSMGHSVAAKAIEGVKDALSMTIPLGTSVHRRMLYVELEEGHSLQEVTKRVKADDYFAHDETHVIAVESIDALKDVGHGVHMIRKGVSGSTHNQIIEFDMKINNPALTSQIMVAAARASLRLNPGSYTLPEIPVIDLLPGDRDEWISKLV